MKKRFTDLEAIIKSNTLPIRITHNDTKINNVIIDKITKRGLAVIDLDTVMPGFSIFDFGDIVRTSVSVCKEDEKNLDKVFADSTRFKAILKGYLSETMDFLQKVELLNLVNGSIIMCLMIGMRFLTDYLNGDIYFKTHYTNHNLDRCRVQFKLANSIIKMEKQLNKIVMEEIK
jgi:aminoglycoside phosphotransferase (APT) family kinase protein